MATVLKNDVHNSIAEIVYNGILNRTSRPYFFLGKTLSWDGGDIAPPTPNTSREYESETRSSIVGMRYVTISDVSFAIDRENWSSGTVYDMYDDRYSSEFPAPSGAQDIADAKMFVLTSDFNIYKCISNNYNQPSTVLPTGTPETAYIGPLADGYVWKYMGTLDEVQRNKFLTPDYLPVTNSTSGFYQSGIALNPIKVSGGSGYVANNTTVIVQGDNGSPVNNAVVTPVINPSTGEITSLTVEDPGTGYSTASILITTPDPGQAQGSGAQFTAQIDQGSLVLSNVGASAIDGQLSFIYVNDGGSGYSQNTTVTISGDGSNATATAIIANGIITGIQLNNRGTGYTFATASITDSGGGIDAQTEVIISPVGGHGNNLVKESFADTLGFQITTADEINQGFTLENDYRQSGLIFDPDSFVEEGAQRNRFYGAYGSACYRVDIPNANLGSGIDITDFVLDQKIYNQTTGKYLVIIAKEDYEVGASVVGVSLLLQSIDGSAPEVGDVYQDAESGNLFTIPASSVTNPTIDKFSGSMVFINNRTPFRKNIEQIVNLRTYIQF